MSKALMGQKRKRRALRRAEERRRERALEAQVEESLQMLYESIRPTHRLVCFFRRLTGSAAIRWAAARDPALARSVERVRALIGFDPTEGF